MTQANKDYDNNDLPNLGEEDKLGNFFIGYGDSKVEESIDWLENILKQAYASGLASEDEFNFLRSCGIDIKSRFLDSDSPSGTGHYKTYWISRKNIRKLKGTFTHALKELKGYAGQIKGNSIVVGKGRYEKASKAKKSFIHWDFYEEMISPLILKGEATLRKLKSYGFICKKTPYDESLQEEASIFTCLCPIRKKREIFQKIKADYPSQEIKWIPFPIRKKEKKDKRKLFEFHTQGMYLDKKGETHTLSLGNASPLGTVLAIGKIRANTISSFKKVPWLNELLTPLYKHGLKSGCDIELQLLNACGTHFYWNNQKTLLCTYKEPTSALFKELLQQKIASFSPLPKITRVSIKKMEDIPQKLLPDFMALLDKITNTYLIPKSAQNLSDIGFIVMRHLLEVSDPSIKLEFPSGLHFKKILTSLRHDISQRPWVYGKTISSVEVFLSALTWCNEHSDYQTLYDYLAEDCSVYLTDKGYQAQNKDETIHYLIQKSQKEKSMEVVPISITQVPPNRIANDFQVEDIGLLCYSKEKTFSKRPSLLFIQTENNRISRIWEGVDDYLFEALNGNKISKKVLAAFKRQSNDQSETEYLIDKGLLSLPNSGNNKGLIFGYVKNGRVSWLHYANDDMKEIASKRKGGIEFSNFYVLQKWCKISRVQVITRGSAVFVQVPDDETTIQEAVARLNNTFDKSTCGWFPSGKPVISWHD